MLLYDESISQCMVKHEKQGEIIYFIDLLKGRPDLRWQQDGRSLNVRP